MPRPTVAQLTYGTCTVILSTLAMLLLSETSSGPGVAVIAVASLALGLLVSLTVPASKGFKAARSASPVVARSRAEAPAKEPVSP